jgi:hypothetical protein
MRLFHALLLLPLFAAPAFAQTAATTAAVHHARVTPAEHFANANITHDGHLTLDQATSGYKSLAKSFSQIDVGHHGYITTDDIKAWRAAKKAARLAAKHAAADTEDGIVRPGQDLRLSLGPKPLQTSTDVVVPMLTRSRRTGVDLPMAPVDGKNPS